MDQLVEQLPTLLAVAVLTLIASVIWLANRIPKAWQPAAAILRGALQLAVLSLILGGIISDLRLIALALLVMFGSAAAVAAGRLGWSGRHLAVCATAIASGVSVALLTVFGVGALELSPRYLLAVGAILLGNAMSTTTLTGRLFRKTVLEGWDEVEAWLALGGTPRLASKRLGRNAIHEALLPSVDQTRTTGLVVLPGAFVGAIFGGLSPFEAARFQLVVLAAILASGSVAASVVVAWLGGVPTRPNPTP